MNCEISNQSVLRKKCLLVASVLFVLGACLLVISFFVPGHEIHSLAEFNAGMWDRLTSFSTVRDWSIAGAALLHPLAFLLLVASMPHKTN